MYIPRHFLVTDGAVLRDLMERFSFATLVTTHQGHPFATHLPFLIVDDGTEHGSLIGHIARANPQWEEFGGEDEALVLFQGPHTYISPSWYEDHPSVPTWNYAAVHAYGVPRVIADADRVRAILRALVDRHEAGFARPWAMDLPDDYLHAMMRGIVAFEMPITRLEGKFKLSQNRPASDRRRVIGALGDTPGEGAQGVRALMREIPHQE
ncbi:MAG: FMN-binding negative transcriptional regulator [Chloroflexota bacterium]